MNDPFGIPWSISDDEWARARLAVAEHGRQSTYDRRGLARFYLLYGDVDFVCHGTRLYGDVYGVGGTNLSLVNLGLALAEAQLKGELLPEGRATFDQLDDDLQIEFLSADHSVRIIASDRPNVLEVSRDEFERGVSTFLRELSEAIHLRVEGFLDWRSMSPLRQFAKNLHAN